jgi:hypothetical protein
VTDYLQIRNWKKFQHYKDRNPPWIKLHFEMLASEDWVTLSDASKLLVPVCMLIASKHEGMVPNNPDYIKRVAYLDKRPNLTPLISCGFLQIMQADDSVVQATARPETERETEERERREEKKEYGAEAPCDFKEEWNLLADRVGLSKIRGKVSESRRRSWHKHFGNGSGDRWRQILALIEASEFCQGSTGWRATFDWVLKPVNAQKVIEGNYGNHEPKETESDVYRAARELAQELEDGEVGIVDATGGVGAEADRDDGRNKTVLARVPGGVGGFHAGRVGSSDQAGEEGLEVLPSDSRPVGGIKTDVEGDG